MSKHPRVIVLLCLTLLPFSTPLHPQPKTDPFLEADMIVYFDCWGWDSQRLAFRYSDLVRGQDIFEQCDQLASLAIDDEWRFNVDRIVVYVSLVDRGLRHYLFYREWNRDQP